MSLISQLQALPRFRAAITWFKDPERNRTELEYVNLSDVLALLAAQPPDAALQAERKLCALILKYVSIDYRPEVFAAVVALKDALLAAQPEPTQQGRTDEYYLAMAALDQYPVDNDGLPKSTSVVFRIHQLGRQTAKASAPTPSAWQPIDVASKKNRKRIVGFMPESKRAFTLFWDEKNSRWSDMDGFTRYPALWTALPTPQGHGPAIETWSPPPKKRPKPRVKKRPK